MFDLPEHHRNRLWTSNVLERVNKETKRHTRVATLFTNGAFCVHLATAVVIKIPDEWETRRVYLTMDEK